MTTRAPKPADSQAEEIDLGAYVESLKRGAPLEEGVGELMAFATSEGEAWEAVVSLRCACGRQVDDDSLRVAADGMWVLGILGECPECGEIVLYHEGAE